MGGRVGGVAGCTSLGTQFERGANCTFWAGGEIGTRPPPLPVNSRQVARTVARPRRVPSASTIIMADPSSASPALAALPPPAPPPAAVKPPTSEEVGRALKVQKLRGVPDAGTGAAGGPGGRAHARATRAECSSTQGNVQR